MDESPTQVTISSFDPIRREVGALALKRLIKEGKIHPASIEETIEKVKKDYPGAELTRATFSNKRMTNADFQGAVLSYANFENCNLKRSQFQKGQLNYSKFLNCDLRQANFSEADLFSADFSRSNLSKIDFI